MSKGPIAMYDYTIPRDAYTIDELKSRLNTLCSRWVFQLEKGKEEGYEHYQCRISFKKKIRYVTLKAKKKAGTEPLTGHFSPTSNPTFLTGDNFYVMKEDTRMQGPWKDTDIAKVHTKQMDLFEKWELREYQKAIIKEAKIFDLRKINLIYDPTGCCGKSLLSEFMEYHDLAEEVPPFRMMDDIFQWVCTRPVRPCYIVDMPRGMKKDRLGDFYSGIEVIKNGVAYDKRYNAKKIRFDRPRIFIFTNTLPKFELMSKDRWEVWTIHNDFTYTIMNVSTGATVYSGATSAVTME